MYLVTTLCLCFCIISGSSSSSSRPRRSVFGGYSSAVGNSVRVAGAHRGPPTSEYTTPSHTGESNSLAPDRGIPAQHRSSRPRACSCPPHAAGQQVNGYRPSTCCPVQQWPSTTRRTTPPWPTARTPPLCTTCRTTASPCTTCWTPPPWSFRRTSPPCTTCRTLLPCKGCQTLPPCARCHQTPPPCTTCRTPPPCTTCRTPPPCTTCRTPPPCMKCRTTRPLLVVRVEIPERPCYTPMPCDTRSARGGGYENAWSDNTPPSAIICHPSATTTRRPCRQPISHPTKCPCTSTIPTMQPCNCKLRG